MGKPPGQNSPVSESSKHRKSRLLPRGRNQRGSPERKGYFHPLRPASNNQGGEGAATRQTLGTSVQDPETQGPSPRLAGGTSEEQPSGSFTNRHRPGRASAAGRWAPGPQTRDLERPSAWAAVPRCSPAAVTPRAEGAPPPFQMEAGEGLKAQRFPGRFAPSRNPAPWGCLVQIPRRRFFQSCLGQSVLALGVMCRQPLQKYLLCLKPEGLF